MSDPRTRAVEEVQRTLNIPADLALLLVDAVLAVLPPPVDLTALRALANRLKVYADQKHADERDLEGNAYSVAFVELRAVLAALPSVHPDCATAGRCSRTAPPATPAWANTEHPPAAHENGR